MLQTQNSTVTIPVKAASLVQVKQEEKKKQAEGLKALAALITILQTEKATPHKPVLENFLLAMMEAVSNDNESLSNMQIVDAQTTMNATQLQEVLYTCYNEMLEQISKEIQQAAAGGKEREAGGKHKATNNSSEVTALQAKYSTVSSEAQAAESTQSGTIQDAQQQTSADSQNLAMKVQMVQNLMSILTALSGMLGRITA